ncbi:MAG TPA: sialate O-acetylesterase [Alphaproteobacteria bacterium]|nr:sialate O-acetylesterase [Alphaproteobacteria bacterium]
MSTIARFIHLDYTAYGAVSNLMSLDPGAVDATQGAAVLGNEFLPSHASGMLQVRIAINAWSASDNTLAIALFRDRQPRPIALATKPLSGGERASIDVTFSVPAETVRVTSFMVRVGPGREGAIYINGDSAGPAAVQPFPFLRIDEQSHPAVQNSVGILRAELDRLNRAYDNTQSRAAHIALHTLGDAVRVLERELNIAAPVDLPPLRSDHLVKHFAKEEVAPAEAFVDGAAVIMVLGQSNAANEGVGRHGATDKVFNWNWVDGKCYRAADPMLGATGTEGSIMARLGERLVADGSFPAVVFAPLAVGGTFVHDWTPQGRYFGRMIGALRRLIADGHAPTHILWHQGEGDGSFETTAENYRARLLSIVSAIRNENCRAPIYIATASRCGSNVFPGVREAQQSVVNGDDVRAGPDTDVLSEPGDRTADAVHMAAQGLDKHAALWYEVLRRPR